MWVAQPPRKDWRCPATLSQIHPSFKRELFSSEGSRVERSRSIIPANSSVQKEVSRRKKKPYHKTCQLKCELLPVCLGPSSSGALIVPTLLDFILRLLQTTLSHLNESSFQTSLVFTWGAFFASPECFSLLFLPSDSRQDHTKYLPSVKRVLPGGLVKSPWGIGRTCYIFL